jgi:hypothetical protein
MFIFFSANELSTLKDIQYCNKLKELYIRSNKLNNLNEIFYLKDLKSLKILWLADEESVLVNNYPNYRLTVLKNLPNLIKLDNKDVTYEEIQNSVIIGKFIENIQEKDNSNVFNMDGLCDMWNPNCRNQPKTVDYIN